MTAIVSRDHIERAQSGVQNGLLVEFKLVVLLPMEMNGDVGDAENRAIYVYQAVLYLVSALSQIATNEQ